MLELPLIQPHKLLDQSQKIWEPPLWLLNLTAVSLWEPILEHHQVVFLSIRCHLETSHRKLLIKGLTKTFILGNYCVNRVTDKIAKIHNRVYCCRSGSAADTQVRTLLNFYSRNLTNSRKTCPTSIRPDQLRIKLGQTFRNQNSSTLLLP